MEYTAASPSASHAHLSTYSRSSKRFPLDSPQNSVKRRKTKSSGERNQLLLEIQRLEEEIAELKREEEEEDPLRSGADDDGSVHSDDLRDIEALEALLKKLDDGALASLLTQDGSETTSIAALQPFLTERRMAILPPTKSVGIEGTGSGQQLDSEKNKLDKADFGPSDRDAEAALFQRISRGEELLIHLERFASIDLVDMRSELNTTNGEEQSRLLRTIRMKGSLKGSLGNLGVEIKVKEEPMSEGPKIIGLAFSISNELRRALGKDVLQDLTDANNLPGFFLAVRTCQEMARMRQHLFQTIAEVFPDLAHDDLQRKPYLRRRPIKLEDDNLKDLALLVDPTTAERLSLRNSKGTRLDVVCAIHFNKWGHAAPGLSLEPTLSHSISPTPSAQSVLDELKDEFAHLCSYVDSPYDMSSALISTIQAFFRLS